METVPKAENKNELSPKEAVFEEQTILGVNEYLQKEAEKTGEKFPPVYIKFFSGPHGTEYDARGIPKELEDADIYIPEFSGWTEEAAKEINNVSFGEMSPDDPDRKITANFLQPALQALASSGKPVVFIDIPEERKKEYRKEEEKFWKNRKPLDTIAYEDALEEIKICEKHEFDYHAFREDYMRAALGPKIAETVRAHTELFGKEKITALLTLGVAHTDIYHKLKKTEGGSANRSFSAMPVYGAKSEAFRRFMFGKEVSEELAGKMLTEEILGMEEYFEKLASATEDTLKRLKGGRMFVEIFKDDGKEIFEKWKESKKEYWEARKGFMNERNLKSVKWREVREDFEKWQEEKGLNKHDFSKYFDQKLLERGIKMPTNGKELDELLAGKYAVKNTPEALS
jgi:hypothetical protein